MVNVTFDCPNCERPSCVALNGVSGWTCPGCGQPHVIHTPDLSGGKPLAGCAACGNPQFYRQKNFPQWLGLSLLAVACAAFFILQGLYLPKPAWIILIGSALIDGLLYYAIVGDMQVCYRCGARHRGLPRHSSYEPFELAIAERYRQERLRREQAKK